MISKNAFKYIKSLHNKKDRNENLEFLVEGEKSLVELLKSDAEILDLFLTQDFISKYIDLIGELNYQIASVDEVTNASTLVSNSAGIAIVKQKQNLKLENNGNEYILVLDNINDPGNFGTIIRIADWYGIKKIICSENTVEFYNPKVIISTMGSFTRVGIYYTDLAEYFKNNSYPVYGTFLDGKNIHKTNFASAGYIIIGSESHGIGNDLNQFITDKITIPRFGGAESLNAGVATAIVLDNLKRN